MRKIERKYAAAAKVKRERSQSTNATARLSDEMRLGSVPKAFRRWPSSTRRGDDRKTLRRHGGLRRTTREIGSISGSRLEKIETGFVRSALRRHRTQNPPSRHEHTAPLSKESWLRHKLQSDDDGTIGPHLEQHAIPYAKSGGFENRWRERRLRAKIDSWRLLSPILRIHSRWMRSFRLCLQQTRAGLSGAPPLCEYRGRGHFA